MTTPRSADRPGPEKKPLPWFVWFLLGKIVLIGLILGGVLLALG